MLQVKELKKEVEVLEGKPRNWVVLEALLWPLCWEGAEVLEEDIHTPKKTNNIYLLKKR